MPSELAKGESVLRDGSVPRGLTEGFQEGHPRALSIQGGQPGHQPRSPVTTLITALLSCVHFTDKETEATALQQVGVTWMPKVRPVHLLPVASGLWLIQAVEGPSLLVDTHPWAPSQWGTEGASLELLQDPGCERAHGGPWGHAGGLRPVGALGLLTASFFSCLESCLRPLPGMASHDSVIKKSRSRGRAH